jgi:hypothetical protein
MEEGRLGGELVRMAGGELAIEREQSRRRLQRMQDRTAEHGGDRVRLELERGHDAEVAAAPADRPEEVGIALLARGDDSAGREHDLGRQQVVHGHPVLAHQPGDPAAEREARDPGERDDAAWGCEPERGGGAVELADPDTGLRADRAPPGVDVDALHQGEVDHQPAVGDGLAGDVVTSAADRDLEPLLPAEVDRVGHVGRVQTACDHGGPLVDQAVVDAPGLVVAGVTWSEDQA